MAQLIQLKRSAVAGRVPTTANLALGELAINVRDGKLYFQRDDSTIQTILTTNASITGDLTLIGTVTATSFVGDGSQLTGLATNLQEVTDNGASTTNGITVGSLTTAGAVEGSLFRDADDNNYFVNPSGGTSAILAGNVGIGTTSPSQKLHVVGKALITDDVQLTGSNPRLDFNTNGASSLRFFDTTNAVERMRINEAGNVGIGDTAPSFILDVNNTSSRIRFKAATGDSNLELSAIAGRDWLIQSKAAGEFIIYDEDAAAARFTIGTSGTMQFNAYGVGNQIGTGNPAYALAVDASGNIIETAVQSVPTGGSGTDNYLAKWIGTSELGNSTIFDDGTNVGIGTATPTAKLEVFGNGGTILDIQGSNGQLFSVTDSLTGSLMSVNDISGLPILEVFDNDKVVMGEFGSNALVVTGSNVGIGTESPDAKLHVDGNIRIPNTGKIVFGTAGTPDDYLELNDVNSSGKLLKLVQDGTTRFDIEGVTGDVYMQGNVGIGTTSPTATLDVAGAIQIGKNSLTPNVAYGLFGYSGVGLGISSGASGVNQGIGFWLNNGSAYEAGRWQSNGNLGIGTTTPSEKLHVNGNAIIDNVYLGGNTLTRLSSNGSGEVGIDYNNTATSTYGFSVYDGTTSRVFGVKRATGDVELAGDLTVGGTITAQEFRAEFITNTIILESGSTQFGDSADDTHTFTGVLTQVTSPTRQITLKGGSGDLEVISDNNTNPVALIKGTGTADLLNVYDDTVEVFSIKNGGNVDMYSGTGNNQFNMGRNVNERTSFIVNDTVNTIEAVQDSDGDSNHAFVLNRAFQGTGANNFNIQKDGTNQLVLNTDGELTLPSYGAGVLVTDANGNISADSLNYPTQANNDARYVNATGDTMTGALTISPASGDASLTLSAASNAVININAVGASFVEKDTGTDLYLANNVNDQNIYLRTKSGGVTTPVLTVAGATQNVGIGTTNPGVNAKLVVAGGGVDIESSTDSLRLRFYEGTTFKSGIQHVLNTGEMISGSAVGDLAVRANAGNMLFAAGGSVERMRITSGGNVGIGTTAPDSILHVHSSSPTITVSNSDTSIIDGQVIGQVDFKSFDGSTNMTNVFGSIRTEAEGTLDNGVNDGGKMVFSTFKQSTALVDQMVIDRDGNVGIGTTTPSRKFHVAGGTSNVTARVDTTNANPNFTLTTLNQQDWSMGIDYSDSGKLKFDTSTTVGASTKMTLNSSGNVGIGTTAPLSKLHVIGDARIGDGTADTAVRSYFSDGTYTEMRGYGLQFNRASSYIRPTADKQKAMFFGTDGSTWT